MAKRGSSAKSGHLTAAPSEPRGGFTYGYQWGTYQPPTWARFPLEGTSKDGYPIHIYPVVDEESHPRVELFIKKDASWETTPFPIPESRRKGFHPSDEDLQRLAVALDWHAESGYSVNPFVSWEPHVHLKRHTNPVHWMTYIVDLWSASPVARDPGTHPRWLDGLPYSLWWIDREIKTPADWNRIIPGGHTIRYEVHSLDVWGNPRDGYEINNQFNAGELEIHEENDDEEGIRQALVDQGHIRAQFRDAMVVDSDGSDGWEVREPEEAPTFTERGSWARSPNLVKLSEQEANSLWRWAWELAVQREARAKDDSNDIPEGPNADEIKNQLREIRVAFTGDTKVSKRDLAEAVELVAAAIEAGADADRNSGSDMPVLQLTPVD